MQRRKFLEFLNVAVCIILLSLAVATSAWAGGKYKTLHRFTGGKDGSNSMAGLIFDATGDLYGTTAFGGAYGGGTVFKLTLGADGKWRENVLYSFITDGTDGRVPYSRLIFDAAGNLYGTTEYGGGSQSVGGVFQLTPNGDGSWTEHVIHSFNHDGTDGYQSYAGLIVDAAGNLYGTTALGGDYDSGTVFKLAPNPDGSWTESVLHSFTGADGAWLDAGLILDAAGNLYGTTYVGGDGGCTPGGCGTVFKLAPNPDGSWTESILHSFNVTDGAYPDASLIFDAAGNLYGTTYYAGVYGHGVVFKLTPKPDGTWKEKVLHYFTGGNDGAYPEAGLIFDAAGNLYGTTLSGGVFGYGVVFRLTLGADGKWRERVLKSFMNHPGADPHSNLIFDAAGNLYGTTVGDWSSTYGSAFEIIQ